MASAKIIISLLINILALIALISLKLKKEILNFIYVRSSYLVIPGTCAELTYIIIKNKWIELKQTSFSDMIKEISLTQNDRFSTPYK